MYRGAGRGFRSRGRGGRDYSFSSGTDNGSSRGGGRPRGLRGKDIGLYYARKSKENQSRNRTVLSMSRDQRNSITDQIQRIKSMEPFRLGSASSHDFMSKFEKNLQGNKVKESWLDDLEDDNDSETEPLSNPKLAQDLLAEHEGRIASEKYREMLEFRRKLPAYKMRHELVNLISANQVVVVSGETGCGKTTQVPQFILDDALQQGSADTCKIICTQPRRISAITIAERVADERAESCGNGKSSVGYQIRLESKLPREKGSILYCTTGVVLQWMRSNPNLDGISHIVLDEIHERDIMSDFLITILKDVLQKRLDLKVILMSATLNAEQFSKYYGKCPMINIPGFTYPVKEYFLEDVLEMTKFPIFSKRSQSRENIPKWHKHTRRSKEANKEREEFEGMIEPFLRDIEASGKYSSRTLDSLWCPESEEINHELIATLVHHIHVNEDDGAILVFLPGWDDISKVHKLLMEDKKYGLRGNFKIFPLHSLMPTVNQKEIFSRPPRGTRKIVIATNIAETSITIDDVVYVVDCGKIKMTNFDVQANIATLKPEWVSLANARQRRGRAGRVQPGICFHLYTRAREMTLEQFVIPEMLRTRLEEVILQIKILELGKASSFLSKVMEPPSAEALDLAVQMLKTINALREDEQLTPLGYHLAQLPMDPHTGKMVLLGAIFSCLDPVLSVAASLSFKDAFVVPLGKEQLVDKKKRELSNNSRSDHLMLANVMSEWEKASLNKRSNDFCWNYFLSESTLRMLNNMKRQFADHLKNMKFLNSSDIKGREANFNSNNEDLVRAIVCAGLYPNVASVKLKKGKFAVLQTEHDKRVNIHPKSVNANEIRFRHPWMVYHLKMKSSSTFIYDCSEVSPMALIFFGKHLRVGEEVLSDQTMIETISIDNFVKFNCAEETSFLFKNLRRSLDELLEYKISNPGVTNWNDSKREGAILKTIINLLSTEPEGSKVEEEYD